MADLSFIQNNAGKGVWLPIFLPGTSKVCMEFLMVGRDSDECKTAGNETATKMQQSSIPRTAEQIEEDNKMIVSACVIGWRDPDDKQKEKLFLNGEELACTTENKLLVFKMFPFSYRQADGHIVNDGNFFKMQPSEPKKPSKGN